MVSLLVKRAIIPHSQSYKTVKEAWDKLANINYIRNEALVAYLRKQLDLVKMKDGDSMDA